MADETMSKDVQEIVPETNDSKDAEIERLKASLAKANSEAGNFRKQLRERQTAEEAAAADRAEKDAQREELLNTLLREKTEGHYTRRLMALGLAEEDALKMAKGLPSEIQDSFFDGLVKYKTDLEKSIRAEIVKGTPKLGTAGVSAMASVTKEAFEKMGYLERVKLHNTDPELYEKYSKGD